MSVRLILTDGYITINEQLNDDDTVYNYVSKALNNFENKDNVTINMIIQTDKQIIEIKIK